MKKKDYIIIVFILLAGLGLFFGLKTYLDKNNEKKDETKEVKNNNSNDNIINDMDEEKMVQKLFDSLIINEDASQSLYFTKKVTSTDYDYNFIAFNLKSYMVDNNISYSELYNDRIEEDDISGSYVVYKLDKDILSSYINNKYNTSIKYDLPVSKDIYDGIRFEGTINLLSRSNEWVLRLFAAGSGTSKLNQKMLNYEIKGDELYIYSKIVTCYSELGGYGCGSISESSGTGTSMSNEVIDCLSKEMAPMYEEAGLDYEVCPFSSLDEATMYTLNNLSDKLFTYKHTFKKSGNNYYWYSSEIVNQ